MGDVKKEWEVKNGKMYCRDVHSRTLFVTDFISDILNCRRKGGSWSGSSFIGWGVYMKNSESLLQEHAEGGL